jgi:hypothetical protein
MATTIGAAAPTAITGAPTTASTTVDRRAAGIAALIGVVLAVVGAILLSAVSGTDLYAAMETSSAPERARLLTEIADAQTTLVVGLAIWMVAFPACAASSVLLARLGRPSPLSSLARFGATASVGAILVFLSAMMAFVVAVAPAHAAGSDVTVLAHVVGFFASTVDWIVTAIVLGLAPAAAVFAGRDIWAPRWLQRFAAFTLAVTVVELIALAADNRDLAFVLVPVGLAHLACAGITALRHTGNGVV